MPRNIGPRIVGLCLLLLMSLPVIFYGRQYVTAPVLHPGDVLETRDCRDCGGSGKNEAQAYEMPELGDRCVMCAGTGKVDVIIPGPNRPTRVHGSVFDIETYDPPVYEHGMADNGRLMLPLPGGIGGAVVVFTPESGEPIEFITARNGRFLAFLPPEYYTVTTRAPGFETDERELEVPPLTVPIWLERAKVIYPPESQAHEQSLYGITLRIAMERP